MSRMEREVKGAATESQTDAGWQADAEEPPRKTSGELKIWIVVGFCALAAIVFVLEALA